MTPSDEELDILRTAPHCLHCLNNVASGPGYHIWTLFRRGYLEQTSREPIDLTYWATTYDLTDLGRWTIEANKHRPAYVTPTAPEPAAVPPPPHRNMVARALSFWNPGSRLKKGKTK